MPKKKKKKAFFFFFSSCQKTTTTKKNASDIFVDKISYKKEVPPGPAEPRICPVFANSVDPDQRSTDLDLHYCHSVCDFLLTS